MNNKEMKNLIKNARKFAKPFRVTDDNFRLEDFDSGDMLEFTTEDEPRAKEALTLASKYSPSFRTLCAVVDALDSLDLKYPAVSDAKLKELAAAKPALQAGR